MKNLQRLFLSAVLSIFMISSAGAWGQKGHDIIAYIAECHLTEKAKAEVDNLLDGYSMVYWSNWADSSRGTEEYKYTSPWHYRNVEEGQTPDSTPTPDEGDVVYAVKEMTKQLKDTSLGHEQRATALKFLVHFVGDLHCPMHAGRKSDLGGNRVPVVFFHNSTNIHSVWDTKLIEYTHAWSHTEWQQQIDRATPEEVAKVVSGDEDDWFEDSYKVAEMIYKDVEKNNELSYGYIDKYHVTLESQLRNGGLRLAHILNSIYDK
ncbi:MAG: S1/P1 nuclease [Rikenellaceae bacterium]